jgi:hypothetical protein
MDNEIFYRVVVERVDPSEEQRRYVSAFGADAGR